jgi:hypothetical protein
VVDDFVQNPEGIKFETQAADETIILFMRKHFITNLSWILLTVVLILLPPLILSGVFGFSFVEILNLSPQTTVAVILAWYLFVTGYAFEQFIVWYFNIYIVTNRRVVDIDFFHLLYKSISAADLEDLEDVTFRMGGIFQAIFNYGDIELQTAGTVTQFEFHAVPHPAQVQKTILELTKKKKP